MTCAPIGRLPQAGLRSSSAPLPHPRDSHYDPVCFEACFESDLHPHGNLCRQEGSIPGRAHRYDAVNGAARHDLALRGAFQRSCPYGGVFKGRSAGHFPDSPLFPGGLPMLQEAPSLFFCLVGRFCILAGGRIPPSMAHQVFQTVSRLIARHRQRLRRRRWGSSILQGPSPLREPAALLPRTGLAVAEPSPWRGCFAGESG